MAVVAQIPNQKDVHPLLRHPRPITRDSAKAQRMLGLIADSEEKLTGLHREKSKTTKWLERPMYAHLDVSDVESEREETHEQSKRDVSETSDDAKECELLKVSADCSEHRPTSFSSEDAMQVPAEPKTKLDNSFNKRRPETLRNIRPISYNAQHLLSPEWTASPSTMSPIIQRQRPISMQPSSPNTQRNSFSSTSSSGSISRFGHPRTWPAPATQHQTNGRPVSYQPPGSMSEQDSFSSLKSTERRPRPTSFATYQHRDRRSSKIASSRGLRNNSYPNYSRPISTIGPKVIPGESIEAEARCECFPNTGPGLTSPAVPMCATLDGYEIGNHKGKDEKKAKNRWSTIPETIKKFTIRRSSTAAQEQDSGTNIESLRRLNLTEENLRHAGEGNRTPLTPKTSAPGAKLLPTPTYSPLEFQHPLFEAGLPPPFAPWAADAPPSPALSQEKRRGSEISLSPTRKRAQSRLSVENVIMDRPESMHSRNSSYGMPSPGRQMPPQQVTMDVPVTSRPGSRRGTPSLERSCIICKATKEPSAFINRRIAGNCWHEPATCYQCLQSHIEKCVVTRGWEHCTCPECGERMTYEDMGAFADDNTFIKWEE